MLDEICHHMHQMFIYERVTSRVVKVITYLSTLLIIAFPYITLRYMHSHTCGIPSCSLGCNYLSIYIYNYLVVILYIWQAGIKT
jgi:hypothetical protein